MWFQELWDTYGWQVFSTAVSGSLILALVQVYRAPRELKLEADRGEIEKERARYEIAQLGQAVAQTAIETMQGRMADMVEDNAVRLAELEGRHRAEMTEQSRRHAQQLNIALAQIARMEQALTDAGVPIPQQLDGWNLAG